jgi:hypothetical protein
MSNDVVEVRFDCGLHDLTEDQILGLLQEFDDEWQISVGVVYGGGAGVVILEVPSERADSLAEEVATKSRELGLTVTVVESLPYDVYAARAWEEVDG